jgi:hypothetical protein
MFESQATGLAYRLLKDPEFFERWLYRDSIEQIQDIIEELHKQYLQTPTLDLFKRAKIILTLGKAEKQLEKLRGEYAEFLEYKTSTGISQ